MRTIQGTIISHKMTRTVVVRVDRLRRQEKYRTYYRASSKFKADVPVGAEYQVGDIVRIAETRPLSRDKRWTVVELVRRVSPEAEAAAEEGVPEEVSVTPEV